MKVYKTVMRTIVISVILLSIRSILRLPHKAYYEAHDEYIYSHGNAPDYVRMDIIKQLQAFQDGYTHRDITQVDWFMDRLFSQDNLMVLGTMPDEIYIGHKKVSKLIYSDWNAWGDCTFRMENAYISTTGNVAWVSTTGYVKFDIPKFLILPLRLSAVMVKENLTWKFQYVQYQFDLNLFPLFFALAILAVWLAANIASLAHQTIRNVRNRKLLYCSEPSDALHLYAKKQLPDGVFCRNL